MQTPRDQLKSAAKRVKVGKMWCVYCVHCVLRLTLGFLKSFCMKPACSWLMEQERHVSLRVKNLRFLASLNEEALRTQAQYNLFNLNPQICCQIWRTGEFFHSKLRGTTVCTSRAQRGSAASWGGERFYEANATEWSLPCSFAARVKSGRLTLLTTTQFSCSDLRISEGCHLWFGGAALGFRFGGADAQALNVEENCSVRWMSSDQNCKTREAPPCGCFEDGL